MTTSVQGIMRGSRNAVIEDGQILRRSFTESYIVISDDGTDDEGHVYNTSGVPSVGDAWVGQGGSTNSGVTCIRVKISDHDASKRLWVVEAEYNSELPDGGAGSAQSGSPTDWSPQIEWTSEKLPVKLKRDINDVVMHNPLFEPYDVETYRPFPILRYSRWQTSFTSATQLHYMNTVNLDMFIGWPPGTALMDEISAEARFLQGLQFWWVTYIVKFNDETWLHEEVVRGETYYATGDPGGTILSAMTEKGQNTVNLNRDGTIRIGQPPLLDLFHIHEYRDFTSLIVGS